MMKRILIVWGVVLSLGACSQVPVVSDVHVNPDKSLTITRCVMEHNVLMGTLYMRTCTRETQ